MVADANMVAQEKGVLAVTEFVRYGGRAAGATRETALPAVVEKCLGSTRAGTKKGGLELILLYAENEDVMGSEGVVQDVIAGLSAKQPKLVAGSVTALTELVREFGPKQVTPKPILKKLPDIFGHSDKTVRAEGSVLAQELHKYLGAALKPTIDTLKDIQAKELHAQFDEIDKSGAAKPQPTRHLYSQKAAAEAAAAAAAAQDSSGLADREGKGAGQSVNGLGDEEGGDFDAYEMSEPVDPMKASAWPANFEEAVKAAKWSERKEVLDAAKGVLTSHIKLQPGPSFDSFIYCCVERIKKDATIHVWLTACQCLEAAAKGMRTAFAKYRDRTMPVLIEKLKERKQSTVEIIGAALDAIFQSVTFGDVLEDILTGTKHKNPAVKTETIRFLVRCLKTTKTAPAKSDIKPIAEALVTACSDSSGDVRDAGTQGLGTLMKIIGDRPLNPYMDQLDDIKKAKVSEEFSKATVSIRAGAGSRPTPPSAAASVTQPRPAVDSTAAAKPRSLAARPAAPTTSNANKENAPPSSSRPAAAAPRASPAKAQPTRPTPPVARPAAAAPAASAASRPVNSSKTLKSAGGGSAASVHEPVKFRFSSDDAEARASDLIPAQILSQIADTNWKERLAGTQAFASWLDREAENVEAEIIVRALAKKPGWKESNFQVMTEVFKIFRLIAEHCRTFGRPSVALTIQPLCDKLGDIKLKAPASETLSLYAEKTSYGFVLKHALGPIAALKAPKAIADSLLWINASILEFGMQAVDVKSLVEHLVSCLKSANAAVRNNATTVMGTLSRFLGSALNSFLGDLNPQLRGTIEGEMEKATKEPAPEPTKFSAELQAKAGPSGETGGDGGASNAAQEEDALEALVPRVDIDKLIPSSAIGSLGDANWKVRKESLEEIQGVVTANTRLKGTLNELTPALKLRYSDSNVMCKTLALDIASKLATGLGKNFEPQVRNYVPPITQCLADAKAPLRASAAAALSAIADAAGTASMIGPIASVLEGKSANPQLRQDAFGWLATRFEADPPDKSCDLAALALPAVQCLDDKLAAVKKAALATLPYIIQRAGYKFVMSQSDGMKTASKNTVVPLIDQARGTASKLAAPAGAAAAAPKAPQIKRTVAAAAPSAQRSASPAPDSPRTSAVKTGTSLARPPSAATRTLQASSSHRPGVNGGGLAKPGFASKLGAAKKAVMASAPGSSSAAAPQSSRGGPDTASSGRDQSIPLLTSDSKHKLSREKREGRGGPQWINAEGTPRPELSEVLRGQCEGHMGADLIDSMFSRDHNAERDHLSALALLSDFISSPTYSDEEYGVSPSEATARVVSNSDLLFKYIAIRLTDNNTSISLKCFDSLTHLVDLLRREHYHMSDYEANCIIPCLIAKFGDAKVAFRDRVRDTFRKATFIYPPSKLLTQYVENGLPSKNARTRAECLAELGYLFSKNGLQVCTPSKTLNVIAKAISDRDANVRTAALLALGECYKIVGDEIWPLVGRLPDKEMSLLEERLKRTTISKPSSSAAPSARPNHIPSEGGAAPRPSGIPASSGLARPRPAGVPPSAAQPAPRQMLAEKAIASPFDEPVAAAETPDELAGKYSPEGEGHEDTYIEEDADGQPDVEHAISEILSSDLERSTLSLKAIHQEMQVNAHHFTASADHLAQALAKQFSRAFGKGTTNEPVNARLRKYLIQVSSSLFDAKMRSSKGQTLASHIEKDGLAAVMTQLLQRLIDMSNLSQEDQDAKMYATYLNKVVIRCFSACDLNVLYSTSFMMLADATEDLRDLSGPLLTTRTQFAELIIKCLWKVGRRLPTSLSERAVEPAQLLADLEGFLQRIEPNEWKSRAREEVALGDLPLRTVKVILSHLVSALGEDVLSHLDQMEQPETAHTYKLLVKMINQSSADNGEGDEAASEGETEKARADSARPSSSVRRENGSSSTAGVSTESDDLANSELRDIFERISQKDSSRAAIKDLYEFQKRFPQKQPHIERSLQSTGPIFQRYIKRALANHAAEDKAVRSTIEPEERPAASGPPASTAQMPSSPAPTNRSIHTVGLGRPSPAEHSASPALRRTSAGAHSRQSSVTSQASEERLAQLRAKFYNTGKGAGAAGSPNASAQNSSNAADPE